MAEQRNRAVWDLVASHALFTQGLKAAGAAMGQFANIVKSTQFIVGASAAAMGVAFFKAAQKGVAMAAILDSSMREVATLIPQTTEQLGFMRDALIDISTRVPQAPELLSAGVYQAISAGITDTTEALRVVETSAKAAVAGLSDTFTAVDAITTVLNAYQLEAAEAARVSDILFKTIELGKVRFPELAQNIGNVVTSASLAGVEFEQVAAAIATVTKFGIGAAEATTSLNRAILSIIKPTKAQRDAAAELGIELSAAALAEKGLIGFVKELNLATEGQVDALAKVFPNIRAFRSISILAGKGIDEYNRILLETENAAGAAGAAFEKINGSLDNQAALLRNKVNVLFQNLGAKILPSLVLLLENVNGVLTTQETRWREAAEAAGDYEGVLKSLREEQIQQLSDQVDDLQKRLSGANQVFVSGLSRDNYGQGIVPQEIQQALEDIDGTIIDFVGNLEGAIDQERILIAEAERLRDHIRETYDGSEALVASLNTRIVQRQAELRDARLLLEVETRLGDAARDRTAAELELEDIQRRARRAREIAPDSDLARILAQQERLAVANVDLEKVQNELKRVGLVTTKATTEELEKLAEQYETGATQARVLLQLQTDAGQVAGGEVVSQTLKVEAQERIATWLREELEIRKLILTIFTKTGEAAEGFVADTEGLVKALTSLVVLGGEASLESLAQLVPEIAEALENLNFDDIISQGFIDRVTGFVDLVAEGLENLNNFVLELPDGVDQLAPDELSKRMNLAGFKKDLTAITKNYSSVEQAAIAVARAMQLWGVELDDMDEGTRELVEGFLDIGDGVTNAQLRMLELIDDISFAINSALALADAFGVSSTEVNSLVRNVDLLGRSIERAILNQGLNFESVFGGASALLSIGANIISGFGESPEQKRRREEEAKRQRENTNAIDRLTVVTAQLAAARDLQSKDFTLVTDAVSTLRGLDAADRTRLRFPGSFDSTLEIELRKLGIELGDIERIAEIFGITLSDTATDWNQFVADWEELAATIRTIDLAKLRETFEGVSEWGRLIADVFDEELTPEREFDLFREAISKVLGIAPDNIAEFLSDPKTAAAMAKLFGGPEGLNKLIRDLFVGAVDDPATIQAWEDFSRFLVNNFDELFRAGFFGGLTTDEAIDLLRDIDSNTDVLQELAEESLGADQSFQIFRGITEITANRLLGTLETDAYWNRLTALNTEQMVGLLGGTPIEAPGYEDLARYIAESIPPTVVIEDFDINFELDGPTLDEEEARTAGRIAAEEFDKVLGDSYVVKRRGFGTRPVRTS